jgi:hypothetical protein
MTTHPDGQPRENDTLLTERVSERLDAVTDELELPPVTVSVDHGVAVIDGDVSEGAEADLIQEAAAATPGVGGVVADLRPSMPQLPSDARFPHAPSHTMRELIAAATAAGCPPVDDVEVVRIVLQMFFRALPAWERQRLLSGLPDDVREAAGTATGMEHALRIVPAQLRGMEDVVRAFVGLPRDVAQEAVVCVLQTLHAVLPEDRRSIQTLLPRDLGDVWAVSPVRGRRDRGSAT